MQNLLGVLKPKFLLLSICVLFLFTRLYRITEVPVSLYWDEASIGYNAYSILTTGKDEWGDFFPIHFRAFGEFKLPVYIYSVVPFIPIFGLNELSVRIPAALYSLGSIIIIYFLTKKITKDSTVALWSSFLLTISPWFFIFSRTGFEATAGLMFYLLGICLFLKPKSYFTFISTISFILSMYSYNSFRMIVPLTLVILIISRLLKGIPDVKNEVNKSIIKWWVLSGFLVVVSLIPIYRLFVYDAGGSRLQNVGTASGIVVVKNYISHFNPQFLFIKGDSNLRHQLNGFGQLFFPDAVFILLGIFYLLYKKQKYGMLIVPLLLIGPLPASITKESPHALRAISMIPFISMLSALGLNSIRNRILTVLVAFLFLGLFGYYFINFLAVYPSQSTKDWQYGYKQFFSNEIVSNSVQKIHVSEEEGQPYIFALFYLKYDPEKFRSEVIRNNPDKWGFSTVKSFGVFEFGK